MRPSRSSPDSPSSRADLLPALQELAPAEGGLRQGESLVVALSGGADSMALLDLLARLARERDLRLVAAHLDHGLRGESADDAAFCREACAQRGIPLHVSAADVAGLARRGGMGLEAAGRQARYRWLETVRRQEACDRIATGHHFDDHVETLLLWLLRGTGLSGMRGIVAARGRLVRPLRSFRRSELRAYLQDRGQTWAEDASNRSPAFLRNRIRHELIPVLERLGEGDSLQRLAAFAHSAASDLEALEELGAVVLRTCRRPSSPGCLRLDRRTFLAFQPALQRHALRQALGLVAPSKLAAEAAPGLAQEAASGPAREAAAEGAREPAAEGAQEAAAEGAQEAAKELAGKTPPGSPGAVATNQVWTRQTLERLRGWVETGGSGRRHPLPGGGWVHLDGDEVRIVTSPEELARGLQEIPGGDPGRFCLLEELLPPHDGMVTLATDRTAYFDADAVRPPLSLRPFQPGDRMRPFGMKGHKKLATLFQERGIPKDLRPSMLVLEDRRAILWAVGVTTDEATRISPTTRRVLRVTLQPAGKDASDP